MAAVTHLGIDPPKLTHYLFDLTSPSGWGKAKFFLTRGFAREEPEVLALALVRQAFAGWPGSELAVPDAVKFRVSGPIQCPDGTTPDILRSRPRMWCMCPGSEDAGPRAIHSAVSDGRLRGR